MALMVNGRIVPDIVIRKSLVIPADLVVFADALADALADEHGRYPVAVEPRAGAVPMRCCGRHEEDENAVDWSSLQIGGYLHWRCRQ